MQAMLRKTGHQRNSMKRNPVYDSTPAWESNVVYQSGGGGGSRNRDASPEWSPNDMVRMSEKYGREDWGKGATRDTANGFDIQPRASASRPGHSVTAELAPGIVVEGYVADL